MSEKSARAPAVGYRAFVRFALTLVAILMVIGLAVVAVVREAPVSVLIAYVLLIGLLVAVARRVFPRKMRVDDL